MRTMNLRTRDTVYFYIFFFLLITYELEIILSFVCHFKEKITFRETG
jgi:hypothetical protein